jgi:hypothetical protein
MWLCYSSNQEAEFMSTSWKWAWSCDFLWPMEHWQGLANRKEAETETLPTGSVGWTWDLSFSSVFQAGPRPTSSSRRDHMDRATSWGTPDNLGFRIRVAGNPALMGNEGRWAVSRSWDSLMCHYLTRGQGRLTLADALVALIWPVSSVHLSEHYSPLRTQPCVTEKTRSNVAPLVFPMGGAKSVWHHIRK